MIKFATLLVIVAIANAAPGGIQIQKSFQASAGGGAAAGGEGPITFENGSISINVAGFHAAAGLGGLLTGDASKGGLHVEAGTPFGQEAAAGIGSRVDENGNVQMTKYAHSSGGFGSHIKEVLTDLTTTPPS